MMNTRGGSRMKMAFWSQSSAMDQIYQSSVDLLVGGISLDDGGVEEMEMDSDGWRVEE